MADTSAVSSAADFRAEAWRGVAGGHRIGQMRDGSWWWVTPDGSADWLCGVGGVRRLDPLEGGQEVLGQLRRWGFNLLGPESAAEFLNRGLAHLETLDLRRGEGAPVRMGGAFLPDVFDPQWAERCAARVAAAAGGRSLFGYLGDTGLAWAQPPVDGSPPQRPTLLQLCLALDPRHAAYHAAWEFVLAPHGGDHAALGRAWEVALPNKEALRQQTLEEQPLTTSGYLRDHVRFTREFAQRYFRTAGQAVRRVDPGRLFLGAPLTRDLPAEIREAAAAQVDLILLEEPPAERSGGPVLLWGVDFSTLARAPEGAADDGVSGLERMLRRGRELMEAAAAHPAVVGYLWKTYAAGDRTTAPFGGGLVYQDGEVAHEYVEPLAALHRQAARRHAAAGLRPSGGDPLTG